MCLLSSVLGILRFTMFVEVCSRCRGLSPACRATAANSTLTPELQKAITTIDPQYVCVSSQQTLDCQFTRAMKAAWWSSELQLERGNKHLA